MKPSTVTCPSCTAANINAPAYTHCNSTTCDLFRCARCRSYGSYKTLTVEAWREYHAALPLELLFEMASLEEEQYDPPRPIIGA
jgi:hypothetical protein